jgi:hypothetical protein
MSSTSVIKGGQLVTLNGQKFVVISCSHYNLTRCGEVPQANEVVLKGVYDG